MGGTGCQKQSKNSDLNEQNKSSDLNEQNATYCFCKMKPEEKNQMHTVSIRG